MPLDVLLGKAPKMHREVSTLSAKGKPLDLSGVTVKDAAERIMRLPTVAEKTFLITIGDRTVTGWLRAIRWLALGRSRLRIAV